MYNYQSKQSTWKTLFRAFFFFFFKSMGWFNKDIHLYMFAFSFIHNSRTLTQPPFMDNQPCLAILPPSPGSPSLFSCRSLITGSVLKLISKPLLPLHPNPIITELCHPTPPRLFIWELELSDLKRFYLYSFDRFKYKWSCNSGIKCDLTNEKCMLSALKLNGEHWGIIAS